MVTVMAIVMGMATATVTDMAMDMITPRAPSAITIMGTAITSSKVLTISIPQRARRRRPRETLMFKVHTYTS